MTETQPKPITAEQAAKLLPIRVRQAYAEAAYQARISKGVRYVVWHDGIFVVMSSLPRGTRWFKRFDGRRKE